MRGAVGPCLGGETALGERIVRQPRNDVCREHYLALASEWRASGKGREGRETKARRSERVRRRGEKHGKNLCSYSNRRKPQPE